MCSYGEGINPMPMLNGSKDEAKAAAPRCLEVLAPCGGLLLGDGAIENLAALIEASEEHGELPDMDESCG